MTPIVRDPEKAGADGHHSSTPADITASFRPAIPPQVAPQQSPLPLRRPRQYTSTIHPAAHTCHTTCPQFLCLTHGVHSKYLPSLFAQSGLRLLASVRNVSS